MLYLIEYDRARGQLVELRSFEAAEADAANEARLDLEIRLQRENVRHEVVILEAASVDALRKTHRRYFASVAELTSTPVA